MKPISKTTKIMFLSIFAIVLLLTGSLLINLYMMVGDGSRQREDAIFHWWVGLLSIFTGIVCVVCLIMVARQTNVYSVIQQLRRDGGKSSSLIEDL
jgi:heme/copper-type cytochrome/quinol oxidase subunit 2